MSHLEVPRFPRGFLLAVRPVDAPLTFVPGPLLPNFYVHPWTNIETAGDQEQFVIVLGHAVSTQAHAQTGAADILLSALTQGEQEFFAALGGFSGRHAVLFGSAADPKVVGDATGMRAVFYAGDGGIVSSHALLVERALGPVSKKDRLPFQYGYPGNRTPYLRTKLLVPNTYFDIGDHTVRRFWPTSVPTSRSVDEVAAEILDAATNALRNIAQERTVNMALTAGLDSRVILAVALHSGVDFQTYTYGDAQNTLRDRLFAADLAQRYDIAHSIVPPVELSAELSQSLNDVNYSPHHKSVVGALMDWFNDRESVAMSGNLLEIGRSFYRRRRDAGYKPPVTPGSMRRLHYKPMDLKVRQAIDKYGLARFDDASELAFQSYIEDSQLRKSTGLLDPFDQFYWEHRMSAWHGVAMNERDFYGIAFIPFNSRAIFEATLGVPQEDRDDAAVFYRLIEMVDSSLLDMPVNPETWPETTSV